MWIVTAPKWFVSAALTGFIVGFLIGAHSARAEALERTLMEWRGLEAECELGKAGATTASPMQVRKSCEARTAVEHKIGRTRKGRNALRREKWRVSHTPWAE